MSIPIMIGVTGHRDLRQEDIPVLRALVRDELMKLIQAYPHSPLTMINSLAAGADCLCAEEALALGIPLLCPLPMAAEEYRADFTGTALAKFDTLLRQAEDVFVAPATEVAPDIPDRDFAYRQAAIYVAEHSHVLLALWDGFPGKPGGCGTAETVDFMLRGAYAGHFKSDNDGAVIHIRTPRQSGSDPYPIAVTLIENTPGALEETLHMTDTFNTEPEPADTTCYPLLPETYITGKLDRLSSLYHRADRLALQFQKRYLQAIRSFSLFGVLLILLFLFYDEGESDIFLLCYGAMMAVYAGAYVLVQRSRIHEKSAVPHPVGSLAGTVLPDRRRHFPKHRQRLHLDPEAGLRLGQGSPLRLAGRCTGSENRAG